MKRATLIILLVALMGGCFATLTPRQEWAITTDVYSTAVETLTALKRAGYIPDSADEGIIKARDAASAALDAMKKAAIASDSKGFEDAQTRLDIAMAILNSWITSGQVAEAEAVTP